MHRGSSIAKVLTYRTGQEVTAVRALFERRRSHYGSSPGGIEGSLFVFVLRGIISPFTHPMFTSMTGIGLGLARQSNNAFVKFSAPLIGLLAAMMLHSLWNFSGVPLGLIGFLGTCLLVMVPALLGVLVPGRAAWCCTEPFSRCWPGGSSP